jgi:hypothetical protein
MNIMNIDYTRPFYNNEKNKYFLFMKWSSLQKVGKLTRLKKVLQHRILITSNEWASDIFCLLF